MIQRRQCDRNARSLGTEWCNAFVVNVWFTSLVYSEITDKLNVAHRQFHTQRRRLKQPDMVWGSSDEAKLFWWQTDVKEWQEEFKNKNHDTQRQTSRPGRTAVGSGRQRMITWSNPGARRTYGHGDRHLRGSVDVANHAGKDLLTGRPDLHTFKNQLTHSFVQRPDCELVTPTARLLWSCALWVLLILEEVFPQDFFFLPTPIKCVFVDDAVQQHQIIKLSSRL